MAKKVGARLNREQNPKRAKIIHTVRSPKKDSYIFREQMVFLEDVKQTLEKISS